VAVVMVVALVRWRRSRALLQPAATPTLPAATPEAVLLP
jgi:hypothetical protein